MISIIILSEEEGNLENISSFLLSDQLASQMTGQMQNAPMAQMGGQMSGQLQNPLTSQLQGPAGAQMGNQMPGQLQGQLQNQLGAGMQPGMNPMAGQMPSQLQPQMIAQIPMQRKPVEGMMMNAPNSGFPRNPTPNQFLRQSPSPSAPSPAGLAGGPTTNQMVASPALAPSPSSQMNIMSGQQRSAGMAPSPSSSLNTPVQPNQSPMGSQEEQAYREKVRQLSRFIEPLQKMIAKIGNDAARMYNIYI